ncbi:FecCD family ABC transporter permease [Nocardioides limicola]|uniref:FecCD family ABC transporter permease n=1 Tax=Nocardioides limicola TaxID=2803368 RepID=UPI00193C25B1|nr:iron ABC transporter permease [Nocardioides sp. DJM-14]
MTALPQTRGRSGGVPGALPQEVRSNERSDLGSDPPNGSPRGLPSDLPRAAHRLTWWITLAALLLLGLLILHLGMGSAPLTPAEVTAALTGRPIEPWHRDVVIGLRMPRGLIAVTAGAMLGVAGAHLQAVTRNVLADPGLLGVSAGAVLAVVVGASFGLVSVSSGWTPVVATGGALASGALVYWLGWHGGAADATRFVLNGVLVSAIGSALVAVVLTLDGSTFGTVLRWIVGTLHARTWEHWQVLWPWAIVSLVIALGAIRGATVLWSGYDVATAVGAHPTRIRLAVFGSAALLTAGAVCTVGAVGFVGLVAAHLVRPLVGHHPARVIPMAAFAGAALLLGADIVANGLTFAIPGDQIGGRASLPTGAVTALVGGPLLLALILKERR